MFYTCSQNIPAVETEPEIEQETAETTIIVVPEVTQVEAEEAAESEAPEQVQAPVEELEEVQEETQQAYVEPEIVLIDPDYFGGVPEAPDLDWFTFTDINVSPSYDAGAYLFSQDIDWSEFVFSDEEIVLPDGTYYAALFVNDTQFGSIEFLQLDGVPRFRKSALEIELNGTLATDYYYIFFQDESDYYPLEYLESVAQEVRYDSNALTLKLYFNSAQVPTQTVSLSSSSYSRLRQSYDVVGNVTVEPAKFSLQSNISAYITAQNNREFDFSNVSASISTSNAFSFWNMTFNLPVSVSYIQGIGLTPNIGNWSGYMDFPNESLRLSFGNVGNAGFAEGTPFGLTLEKNYGYGTGSAMGNQYSQTITLTEDSTVEIKINGNVIYTKTLSLGVYRLTDFAFVQGSNNIEVTIHPVSMGSDTSADEHLRFDQNYDSSLLAMGESTWRFGVSIPKVNRRAGTASSNNFSFVVPSMPSYSASNGLRRMEDAFNLSALSVFWEQSVGITHEYSQTHSFSFIYERNSETSDMPGEYSATFGATVSGVLATGIGTTRGTLNGVLVSSNPSSSSLSLNLSQSFVNEKLKPLSLSGTYSLSSDSHQFSLSTGYSFSIDVTRIGLNLNSSYRIDRNGTISSEDPFSIGGSLSLSTRFGKNTSFSLSSSMDKNMMFSATASLSFTIGKTQSVNASASSTNFRTPIGNLGWSFRPSTTSRNSFQVNLSNLNYTDLRSHSLAATWSRAGDFVGMSLRTQASNMYSRFMTTLSLNTALAYADGSFAMTSSLYGPFLIIDPQGSLKDARISVSSATDSNSSSSRKSFGNVLYTKLSMYKPSNVVVYASSGSLFSSSGSFLFKVTPYARQGFVAKIQLESSIAVSGVLRRGENQVYDSYSSPIYRIQLAENDVDVQSMEIDNSSYFFTDIDGRFILSDLKAGVYMFDLEINGQWYAAFFEVPEVDRVGYVSLYKDFDASTIDMFDEPMQRYNIKSFDDSYAGSVFLEHDSFITESEYWDLLFSLASDDFNWDEEEDPWADWTVDTGDNQYITNEAL